MNTIPNQELWVSRSTCKELGSHLPSTQQEQRWTEWKWTALLRSIRKLTSEGKPRPQNGRDRQVDRKSHSTGVEGQKKKTLQEPVPGSSNVAFHVRFGTTTKSWQGILKGKNKTKQNKKTKTEQDKKTHRLKSQDKHQNQIQIWQRCWNWQAGTLKPLWLAF